MRLRAYICGRRQEVSSPINRWRFLCYFLGKVELRFEVSGRGDKKNPEGRGEGAWVVAETEREQTKGKGLGPSWSARFVELTARKTAVAPGLDNNSYMVIDLNYNSFGMGM